MVMSARITHDSVGHGEQAGHWHGVCAPGRLNRPITADLIGMELARFTQTQRTALLADLERA